MAGNSPISGAAPLDPEAVRRQHEIGESLLQKQIEQIPTIQTIEDIIDATLAPLKKGKSLDDIRSPSKKEMQKTAAEEEVPEAVEATGKAEEMAERFQKQNPELQKKSLLLLLSQITPEDDVDAIIRKVLSFYPDKSLATDALDFLIQSAGKGISDKAKLAKENLYSNFAREIIAGKNIATEARVFSEKGLGSPTALRDIYRNITGTPRETIVLFQELSSQFSFAMMVPILAFLLHSLGADLKSKGPSIPSPELKVLMDNIRAIQAIIGVYRFFKSRMTPIHNQFTAEGLTFPSRLNFEALAKQLVNLLQERYITTAKVLQIAKNLGISEELMAQIIIYTQMLESVRNVAPRLYKSNQQREDLLEALKDTLEQLEEKQEKKEEEEEEKEIEKKKRKGDKKT